METNEIIFDEIDPNESCLFEENSNEPSTAKWLGGACKGTLCGGFCTGTACGIVCQLIGRKSMHYLEFY